MKRAYRRLHWALEDSYCYHGHLDTETQNNEGFLETVAELNTAYANAIRAGLLDDPDAPPDLREAAQGWIVTQIGLGRREMLRRARIGLERGVRGTLSVNETKVYAAIAANQRHTWNIELKEWKRRSQAELQDQLTRAGKLPRMTQQAFNKRVRKLLRSPPKRGG